MSFGDIQTGTDICVSIDGTRMANCKKMIFIVQIFFECLL